MYTLLFHWKVQFVFQGRGEWQGNSVHSVVLSRCPAAAMASMCQGQKPVSGVSRISPLNTKKCQLPTRLTQGCQGLLFLWIPSWLTSDAPQSNMMDLLLLSSRSERDVLHVRKRYRWAVMGLQKLSAMTDNLSNNASIPCMNIRLNKHILYIYRIEFPPA